MKVYIIFEACTPWGGEYYEKIVGVYLNKNLAEYNLKNFEEIDLINYLNEEKYYDPCYYRIEKHEIKE